MRALLLLAPLGALLAAPAQGQRVIAQDTLSSSTPAAITCGFCAGERYGVIFRELEPAGGLQPADFPLTLRSLRIAVAAAHVTGAAPTFTCEGLTTAGTAIADLELWAGTEPPSGSLSALPLDGPWTTGEELVWAAIDVPLSESTADTDGSPMIQAGFNELQPVDELEQPIVLGADIRYVRAVVLIRSGTAGSSASCDAVAQEPPSVFPLRDNDGVIASERAFIYAGGAGWLWNEEASIGGDWAIRLEVRSEGSPDADAGPGGDMGAADDAGAGGDLGAWDGAVGSDMGGVGGPAGGGCDCRVGGAPTNAWPLLAALLLFRRRLGGG